MKQLTYKILKNQDETVERPKIEFNREFYLNELKKEIGLSDYTYEQIRDGGFKVQLNSPTGRSCSFEIPAINYIDQELKNIEQAINEENENPDDEPTFDIVTIQVDEKQEQMVRSMIEKTDDFWEWVDTSPPILEIKMEQPTDNFKYYDVKINNLPYTVIIYDNGTQDIKDQINRVRKHFLTTGERKRNMLLGTETIISFYQWTNLVTDIEQKTDYLSYEDIAARMNTIFEGVEGLDLPEGFK